MSVNSLVDIGLQTVVGRSRNKRQIQVEQRSWLAWLENKTGKSLSSLATEAGLASNALTRLANREDYEGVLSPLTVRQIMEATGLPGPDTYQSPEFEEELIPFRGDKSSRTASIIAALLDKRSHVQAQIVRTRALEDEGYMIGDIIIVDQTEPPKPGDAVCAQIHDMRGGAETILRVYRRAGPIDLLMPAEGSREEPILVDGERVKITGVVTETYRPRNNGGRRAA